MSIGLRIKNIRLKRNLTQKQLAELADIPLITLQQYERGVRKQPKIEMLLKLAKALNTTTSYLQGQTDDPDITQLDINKIFQRAKELKIQYEHEINTWGTEKYLFQPSKISDDFLSEQIVVKIQQLEQLVYKICGMCDKSIEQAENEGVARKLFDPRKIECVSEFIQDNKKTLRRMMELLDE